MSPFNEERTPADVLRAAAALVCIDGWDPAPGVRVMPKPKYGRFYSATGILYTIMRVRHLIQCSWMVMVRACEMLAGVLGVVGDAGINAWERTAARNQEHIERTLLRAAYRWDARAPA